MLLSSPAGASAQPTGFTGLLISEPETVAVSTVVVADIECLGADPSTVTFSIEDASAVPFSLHPPAGSALVKLNRTRDLDYEAGPRLYQFNITCSDSMGSVSGTVQVTVTSVNEYPPEAEIDVNGVLPETSPAGTVILSQGEDGLTRITATDMDAGEDGVLTFTATYSDFSSHFSINQTDGKVTLTMPFDVDAGDGTSVVINVRVCDQETPPDQCPIVSVTLFIISVNEFDPHFSQASYNTTNASYSEGEYSNEVITTAECRDSDVGIGAFQDIELHNLPGELSSVVGLMVDHPAGTAQVVLNGTLDYDSIRLSQLRIELRCYDNGDPARDDIATVTLNIQDIDDNLPVFSSDTYTASVSETLSAGEEVLTLQCSDGDYGAGALVGMEFNDSAVSSTFSLDPSSGVVSLHQALDYDTGPQHYQIVVRCYDSSGNEAFAVVSISVKSMSVNEFDPQFSQASYNTTNASYSEGEYSNEVITTAECHDSDVGIGAFQDIELHNLPGELSSVVGLMVDHPAGTAQVVLNGTLDYDSIRLSQLQIELRCYDSGDPARDDIATITLNIQDIDDNLPVFSSDTYTASVSESLSAGEEVLTLQCSDGDYGAGALVGMEFNDSAVSSTFSLDLSSGVLSLRQALDYDTGPQHYQIVVRCYDSSGNEAFAVVSISVSRENDESDFPLSPLEIILIVVGAVILLLVIAVVCCCILYCVIKTERVRVTKQQ